MDNYIVAYDLNKTGKNYAGLIESIMAFPGWAKLQKSVWYVKSNLPIQEIFGALRAQMDDDDSLVVVNATNDQIIFYGISKEPSDCLDFCWPRT